MCLHIVPFMFRIVAASDRPSNRSLQRRDDHPADQHQDLGRHHELSGVWISG